MKELMEKQAFINQKI